MLKKANGFLAEAVRLSKAEKLRDGYLVVGKSGKPYTVNSDPLAV